MASSLTYVFALYTVVAIVSGQLLFKKISLLLDTPSIQAFLRNDGQALILLIIAFVIYSSATVSWILALRDLPLGRSYMFMSAGFVIVPFLSQHIFGEELTGQFWIGVVFILAGVFLTQAPDLFRSS